MSEQPTAGPTIAARVDAETKQAFINRCSDYQMSASDMLREIVVAFNEDRLKILVPATQLNTLKGLHHVA